MTPRISIVTLAAAMLVLVAALFPGPARATLPGGSGGVAFVAGADGLAKVCIQQLDGSSPECLSAPWAREVALQPISGRWLVFVASWGSSSTLYTVDRHADTLSATFVYQVANTTLKNPTWIDGSTIAFAESGEIYTVQVQDGQLVGAPVDRTNTPGATESDPTWLPNYRIGYVKDGDLWTMGLQGQNQRCVKESVGSRDCYVTSADESDLNFSLAGLYYSADGNIHRLKLNKHSELTQAPVPVAATRADERGPAPSPNGKELVFERDGELVHMKNATTTMDEKAVVAGHAPDWGSVFKGIALPDEDEQQQPHDVKVEAHGTFVVLDFKTVVPDDFVMVTLEEKETGAIEAAFLNEDPATTQWNDVIVNGLTPGREHILQIHAAGKLYEHPTTVKTLERHVTIAFQEVGGMEDDGDPGSCGDFLFGFHAHAGSQSDTSNTGLDEISICDDDEPYTWDPSPDIVLHLDELEENWITVYILAVDDDADCILCADVLPWPGNPPDWGTYKERGEWSEEETPHNVGPDSNGDEEWTHGSTLEVQQGDGNPHLKWWYTITVSYS